MFSERTGWPREPNPLSRLRDRLEAEGRPVTDLTVSNPTQCGFPLPQAFREAWLRAESLIYQPEPLGLRAAREAVARYYLDQGIPAKPTTTWLAAGTSELYAQLCWILADPGDTILVPSPGYPLFSFITALTGTRTASYDLTYNGTWQIDLDDLLIRLEREKPKAVILVSPNNPTGTGIDRSTMLTIEALAARHGAALIVDHVFSDYYFEAPHTRLPPPGSEVLTILVSGISKVLGLPQYKLSWASVFGPCAACAELCERASLVADTFLTLSTPVQEALPEWLARREAVQTPLRTRTRENLELLRRSGLEVLPAEAGWNALVQVPGWTGDDETLALAALESGVAVQPGYYFDLPENLGPTLSLSLLPPKDQLEAGLAVLRKLGTS